MEFFVQVTSEVLGFFVLVLLVFFLGGEGLNSCSCERLCMPQFSNYKLLKDTAWCLVEGAVLTYLVLNKLCVLI